MNWGKTTPVVKNAYLPNGNILLVEDNQPDLLLAITILEKLKCTVVTAANGKDALAQVKKKDFDLIFMDCQMPEMDGFEVTERIRQLEEKTGGSSCTPIIAVTAYAMKGNKKHCHKAGMDDYIAKPMQADDIILALMKWLPHKIRYEDQKQADQDIKAIVDYGGKLNTEDYGLNLETYEDTKNLMGERFAPMIKAYLDSADTYLQQAEQALHDKDFKALANSVHPLKSSSASIGFTKISKLAKIIEEKADESFENNDVPEAEDIQQLRQFVSLAEKFLSEELKSSP